MLAEKPIGVFDSGIGGLSVLKEMLAQLPGETIIYVGDSARVPYGPRPVTEITRFLREFLDFFAAQDVKLAICACNTMTTQALPKLIEWYPFPVVGVDTGAALAAAATRNKRVGVLATQGTIASGVHVQRLQALDPSLHIVPQACPEFVPLVEAGILEGEPVETAVRRYLTPLQHAGVDTVILGCTHYPFLAPVIRRIIGDNVILIDPAAATVAEARALLRAHKLLRVGRSGGQRFCFTRLNDTSWGLVEKLLGRTVPEMELVRLEQA